MMILFRKALNYAVTLWLSMMMLDANAQSLVVIYDNGQARPITEFITVPKATPGQTAPSVETAGHDFMAQLFPIHTPELTPGLVKAVSVNLNLPQAFFMVGTDPLSQRWLAAHRDRLKQLNAVGLVVEASRVEDFQALKSVAGDLPLSPAPASDLAKQLGLSHYPVLVTAQGIEQ